MIYTNDEEIIRLVKEFEAGAIPRKEWTHAAHLTVALWYARDHDLDLAVEKMRVGIFNLLKSFDIDLAKEMPYHETLTVFWMRTVFAYLENSNERDSLRQLANNLIKTCGDSGLSLKFYSREVLFSVEALAKYIEPDLTVAEIFDDKLKQQNKS